MIASGHSEAMAGMALAAAPGPPAAADALSGAGASLDAGPAARDRRRKIRSRQVSVLITLLRLLRTTRSTPSKRYRSPWRAKPTQGASHVGERDTRHRGRAVPAHRRGLGRRPLPRRFDLEPRAAGHDRGRGW